jgi:hypothetical protein
MATTASAAPPAAGPGWGKRAERRFFTGYMTTLAIAILIGFAPSFFLRGLVEPFGPLRPLRPLVIVHGTVTASWVLLFPIQARLIAAGRWQLHVKLGKIGFLLGATMAATAYLLAVHLYHEPPPPGLTPALNVLLPLTDFFAMATLLTLGWRRRLDAQAHKRIMTVIGCLLAGAAIFRIPTFDRGTIPGLVGVHVLLFATVLPLWAWDLRTRGKPHRTTVVGSAILFVDMFGRLAVALTPVWPAFVTLLPGFGRP